MYITTFMMKIPPNLRAPTATMATAAIQDLTEEAMGRRNSRSAIIWTLNWRLNGVAATATRSMKLTQPICPTRLQSKSQKETITRRTTTERTTTKPMRKRMRSTTGLRRVPRE